MFENSHEDVAEVRIHGYVSRSHRTRFLRFTTRSIFRKALISKLRKKTATPVGELFLRIVYREDSSSRSGRIQKSYEELNASDSYGRF